MVQGPYGCVSQIAKGLYIQKNRASSMVHGEAYCVTIS